MKAPELDEVWLQDALERYATSRDRALRDEIQRRSESLATRCAWRFVDSGEQFDDLLQVARLALFKSIERYDHTRGIPFGAFATPTILGELKRHFRDHTWSVHVPRRAKDLRPLVNAAVQDLSNTFFRSPKVSEIAQHLGVTDEAVLEALDANNAYRSDSLDTARSDHFATAKDGFDSVIDREVVTRLLEHLAPRERTVVYLRFFDELSQSQIAAQIGTSQVHVGRILAASVAKLRALLETPDGSFLPAAEG